MKKIVMLLLVLLTFIMTPITSNAAIIRYCKVYISNNNFGTLENITEVTGRSFVVGGNESIDLMDTKPQANISGWYFVGWIDNETNQLMDNSVVIVSSNRYFTPKYASFGYVITFDLQDGTSALTEMKSFGDSISMPTPTQDFYEFGGWYTDALCTSEKVVFPYTVKGNVTFYAKWTSTYDVRFFDVNGIQVGDTQIVEHGNYATAPDDPTKEGHTFAGWSNGEGTLLSGAQIESLEVTNPVEYTAVFDAKEYDVCFFDVNGIQVGDTQIVEHGNHATAPDDPTKEGHTFAGWSNGTGIPLSGAQIGSLEVTNPVEYTAVFDAKEYDVCFLDDEGNRIGEAQQVEHGKYATAPDDPIKEGYTFAGWTDGTQTLSKTQIDEKQIAEATDYTAVFETNSYVVSFQANGVAENKSVEFGHPVLEPDKPTRDGHDFAGWFIGEGSRWRFETDTMPAKDITLYANWDIRQYTVAFYEQDGITPIGLPQTVNWGSAAVLEAAPVVMGYAFDGWVLSGSDTSEADSLINVRENINAAASYIKDGFTVTFVDDMGRVIDTDGVCAGGSATPPNAPDKEGYTFIGWDASLDSISDNITVTARYEINSYTVRFVDEDGGELSVQNVNWNASAIAPAHPNREGYAFTGWDASFDKVTSDLTVRAQYRPVAALDKNAGTQEIDSMSTDNSDDPNERETELGFEAGEMVTMESKAVPAATDSMNAQTIYGEPISLANRSFLLDDHSETLIIVLGLLTALMSGVSIWIVRVRKRH